MTISSNKFNNFKNYPPLLNNSTLFRKIIDSRRLTMKIEIQLIIAIAALINWVRDLGRLMTLLPRVCLLAPAIPLNLDKNYQLLGRVIGPSMSGEGKYPGRAALMSLDRPPPPSNSPVSARAEATTRAEAIMRVEATMRAEGMIRSYNLQVRCKSSPQPTTFLLKNNSK